MKRPRITRKRLAIAAVAAFLLYTLGGFFGVPLLVRHVILPGLSNKDWLNGKVSADKVRCNPFTFRLTFENLALTDLDDKPLLRCGKIVADAQVSTIWAEGYRFKELSVEQPDINLVIEPASDEEGAGKKINVDEMLDLRKIGDWIEALPRVAVQTISVKDGSIEFSDLSLDEPVHQQLRQLGFTMNNFDTHAEHENAQQFTTDVGDRGKITWAGRFYLNPLTATGELDITDLDLARYSPYYRGAIELRVLAGELSAKLTYDLAPLSDQPVLRAVVEQASVSDFAASGSGSMTWLIAADRVQTGRITTDALASTIDMDSLLLDGGVATVLADRVALADLSEKETETETAEPVAVAVVVEPTEPAAPTEPAEPAAPTPTESHEDSPIVLTDLLGKRWSLTLKQFDAQQQFVLLTTTLPAEPVRAAAARELADSDTLRVIALDRLGVADLNVATPPLELSAARIEIDKPALAFDIDADRRAFLPKFNVADAAPTAPPTPPRALPPLKIERIALDGASILFKDASTERPAELQITDAGGELGPIFTSGDGRITLDLHATVSGDASATVAGQLNPFPATRYVDVALTLQPMTLDSLDGYFRRYLGYQLDDGAAKLELVYKVDGTQLEGSNRILLQKFYLGDKSKSDEAIDLPIKLGVGLLRDTKGDVKLDVPVQGDLADPKLKIGGLIVQALVNTFSRIATAPFAFLSSSFGDGETDLSFVAFEPGSTAMPGSESIKLDTLAKALTERPSLTLKIHGQTADVDALILRRAALRTTLQQQIAETLPETDPLRADPSRIVVDDETYRNAILTQFDGQTSETTGTQPGDEEPATRRIIRGGRSATVVPRPAAEAAPPEPAEGEAVAAVPFEQAEATVLAAITLPDDALPSLAQQRAGAIVKRLGETADIDAARLIAAEASPDATPPQPGPIAWFELE